MRVIVYLLFIFLPHVASGRDLFVDNVLGRDDNTGNSANLLGRGQGPLRTITRALKIAKNGDRIILANTEQPYRESITLQAGNNSGIPNRPFVIVGNGAILDGRQPVPVDAWEHWEDDVFRFRPKRLTSDILYLDDIPAKQVVVTRHQPLPKLQPLEWSLYRGHIYFRVEEGRMPGQYDLSFTALQTGITLYEVMHVEIYDLIVQGFSLDGINAHDSVFKTSLLRLTSRGNGRAGISIGGSSQVRIESCLVGNNGQAQVRTEGLSHARIINSDLLDDPAAPALVRDGGTAVVQKAP